MNEDQFNQYYELLKNTFDKRYEFDQLSLPIFSQDGLKIQVHSAAISRNRELIVCGCCKGTIIVYDLISKSSYFAQNSSTIQYRKHQIICVSFAHCYDYIVAANSQGDLLIYKVKIDITNNCYEIDLIKYYSAFHEKPIHTIQHSSVDQLLLISQGTLHVYNLSDLLIDKEVNQPKPMQTPQLEGKLNNVIITKIVIMKTHQHLYFGFRYGEIYKVRLDNISFKFIKGELRQSPKQKLLYTLNKQALIVCLEVSQDRTLMAIAYQLKGQTGYDELESHLIIRYLKKNKTIYSQSSISKNKISQLIFFNDNTHLIIGSWDSTFQILNIKQKQILTQYTISLHPLGIISLFPIQEVPNFPTILSVGQDNIIKKTFFGNVKQSLFEFIPYICWVELRISQELTFQSALKRYLKILYLESMGVDHFKQVELQSCLFGYQLFNPLLQRIIDYGEYKSRSPALFNLRYPTESLNQRKRRLPPIPMLIQVKQEPLQQSSVEDQKIDSKQNLFRQHQFYLYKKIMNGFDSTKVTMLVLQKCPYIFELELGLFQDFTKSLLEFKNVRYIDISYNNLQTNIIVNLLEQFKGVKLDFLNLGHNNIGSQELFPSQIITLLEGFTSVSIRANNLSDADGETILNSLNNFTNLKILDLSGNLDFGDQTLQALQRITLLSKQIQFAIKKGDKEDFIKHLTFMEDKDLFDEDNEIELIKDQVDNQFPQTLKYQPEINEDSNLILNQLQIDKKKGSQSFERSSSSSSSANYVSLELLCLQFRPERCEEAMKTATDFLVQRTPTNFYIYVVDNKIDNVWESSISVFYTRNLKKINDHIKGCILGICLAFYNCGIQAYKTMYNEGYYCFKRIFCSSFFLYKYILCIFCTFMTTQFGKFLQNVFGVQNSYYQFNPKSIQLELFLYNWRNLLFFLFAIYFLSFYFVIVFLPIIYVNDCRQSDWNGHLLYLTFATYSFFFEGIFGYKIISLKVTSNEYTDGSLFYRMFFIIKDLIISQLTKFQLYANICFIMVIYSCDVDVFLSWIGVSIIGINLLFDLALLIRYILIPYLYKLNLTYVDVFVQFSTLYQMNIVSNLLEIWSKQNRFPFPILKDAPQKVVVAMIKAFFLDIPLLLIQVIYLGLHQEKIEIGILMVSLISSIIHGIFANISMLSITRAAQINQEIIMNEYSFHITNKMPPKNKSLRYYFRKVGNNYKQIVEYFKFKNENIYNNLRDQEEAIINMPHNLKQISSNKVAQVQPIKQARKGVTVLGNKQIRQNISKKKIQESQPYLKKAQAKAVLELFGSTISTWKLKSIASIDIINILLVDVSRDNFQLGLDWDSTKIIFNNIQITSLQKQIEAFNQAYYTFTKIANNQNNQNNQKQEQSQRIIPHDISILDIGFGSGYSSLVFAALALKYFSKIEIHLVDHVEETKLQFEQLLEAKFKWIQEACQFKIFIQDCLFDIQLPKQYDFINIGAATTRGRIENIKKQYLKPGGVLFGFEIFSPIESNGIVFKEEKYSLLEMMKQQEIQSIMPIEIQCDLIKNQLSLTIKKIHDQFTSCCFCSKDIDPLDKCFINHFWGEVLCFECGMDNYLSQSKETDITKLQYRSNVIYYPGQGCDFTKAINNQLLLLNTSYRINVKANKNRHHQSECYICSRNEPKIIIGFRYICLHDNLSFCSNCGRKIVNQEINVPEPCSQDHMLLRIIFA